MKQITKTPEITAKLRASFGETANIDNLGVWEVSAANTRPIRQNGLFKGARITQATLDEVVAKINEESIPLQLQHKTGELPTGRAFSAKSHGDEARVLIALDTVLNATEAAKLDSGIIDQVSIGLLGKHLFCSKCQFDFQGTDDKAFMARFTMTDPKSHTIGKDGMYLQIEGVESLFELSLVGQGGLQGSRVINPTDSAFAAQYPRLAASAVTSGHLALHISPEPEDDNMDFAQISTQLQATSIEKANAVAQLSVMTGERDQAKVELGNVQTALGTVTGERDVARSELSTMTGDRDAKVTELTTTNASLVAATAALTKEATTVLTAVGKNTDEISAMTKDKDATALLALIDEHRAAFAGIIPAGGKAKGADGTEKARARSNSAFQSASR